MKTPKIEAEKVYEITVGKNTTTVKVLKVERRVNGTLVYDCLNIKTDKRMTVSDAKRFLREIKPEQPLKTGTKKERSDGTVSGIEAAYIVLKDAAEPLNIRQIMEQINQQGLAKLSGKTPWATVSAAMQREIGIKGTASRFVKTGKGLFAAR